MIGRVLLLFVCFAHGFVMAVEPLDQTSPESYMPETKTSLSNGRDAIESEPLSIRSADQGKISVLCVLQGADRPLDVSVVMKGDTARGLFLLGPLFNSLLIQSRNSAQAKQLNETVGSVDLSALLISAVQKQLDLKAAIFDVHLGQITFDDDGKIEYDQLVKKRAQFVLRIRNEFTGLSATHTHDEKSGDVAVIERLEYELIDVFKKTSISESRVLAHSLAEEPIAEAIIDPTFVKEKLPMVVQTSVAQIIGELYRGNTLNKMAESGGKGDQIPAFGEIIDNYAKQFTFTLSIPHGWQETALKTMYARVAEPKSKDRFVFGIRYEVDLTIKDIGNAAESIDDYIVLSTTRMADLGALVSTMEKFSGLSLTDDWEVFSICHENGKGKYLKLYRKIDDQFVEVVTVIFNDSFDELFLRYKNDIEHVINGRKFIRVAEKDGVKEKKSANPW